MVNLDDFLNEVEKPARYIGGEWNSIIKNKSEINTRFAFCFPDTYEIGMSYLGMKILYHILNEEENIWCERVFAPWPDMEQKMRERNILLYGLESKDPICEFDFVGFTLQYEMSYTNILNMLYLGGIPIYSKDRKEDDTFVCAGGPCACNPEPLADFIDFFMIGDGEEIILEVMEIYSEWKESNGRRIDFLKRIANLEGIYVPAFYNVNYNEDNTVQSIAPVSDEFPEIIKRRVIADLNKTYFPENIIVPFLDIVHNRVMLELFRGCIRGCRFCQAGYIYRPVRERSVDYLIEKAKALISNTGYDEISMMSLSTSDYSCLGDLTDRLLEEFEEKKVSLSLPSLRVDSFSLELMEKTNKVRKSGLTFAPEAGTQRLRNAINKGVNEEDILNSSYIAFNGGYNRIKLYFMLGLPTETMEDVKGISDLANEIVRQYFKVPKDKRVRGLTIALSTSTFVPKPFTPFQWEAQDTLEEIREKQTYLNSIMPKQVTYSWHESKISVLEAVFARGDRRVGSVIYSAWKKGCKFDSWGEFFLYDKWMEAFDETGVDIDFYAHRKRSLDEVLPWDHIDIGVTKEFLKREYNRALNNELTPNCRDKCSGCGSSTFNGGICVGRDIQN